jgi:transcriptional regulator with XRE-family HTH domain
MRYWFGEKIRAVRERKGLTLKEVAENAGVSESLVSQIERNRVSPASDTLLSLADVLDLDLEYLFSDYRRERLVRVTRSNERDTFTRPGVLYERLAQLETSKNQDGIEAYYITIEAGQENRSTEYGHPGWELGIVVEGNAELSIGTQNYELAPGDSVSFRSDAPHVIANRWETPLKILWVITPPKTDAKR